MSGILVAVALLVVLIVVLLRGKLKKTKPIIEIEADENTVKELDLKPGEYVRMEPDSSRKEVTVYTTRSPRGDRLGAINNGFVFRNVTKRNIEARIDSVTGNRIMLEIIRVATAR